MKYAAFPVLAILSLCIPSVLAAGDDATRQDLDKMQGTWLGVYHETDGKIDTNYSTLVVEGANYTLKDKEGKVTGKGTHKLDAARRVKTIDITTSDGRVMKGIYEIKGDIYIAVYSRDDGVRPTDFSVGNGARVMIWRRQP